MTQQTAVEWYIEQHKILSRKADEMPISELITKIKDIELQAKQMEKWEMEKAYNQLLYSNFQTFEQYYTLTYTTRLQNETN